MTDMQDKIEFFTLTVYPKTPKAFRNGDWYENHLFKRPTLAGIVAAAEAMERLCPDAWCDIGHLERLPDGDVKDIEPGASFRTVKELLEAFRPALRSIDAVLEAQEKEDA